MSQHPPGIAGWSEQESMGVLVAMADVDPATLDGSSPDALAAALAGEVLRLLRDRFNISGVDEVLLDPPEHPATSS